MFNYDVATMIGAGSVAGMVSAFLYGSIGKIRQLALQFFQLFVHSGRIADGDWRLYKCATKWVADVAGHRIRAWNLGYTMNGDASYADRYELNQWVEQPWVWVRVGYRFYLVHRVRIVRERSTEESVTFSYYYIIYTIGAKNLKWLMGEFDRRLKEEQKGLEDQCIVTMSTPDGTMEYIRSFPVVTFEDVLCPHADYIRAKLDNFMSEEYRKRLAASNIPHKLVILLYGPPGNGKSTAIRAIAAHLNRNIALLSSENFMSDRTLMTAVNHAKRDVAVLEDVDAMTTAAVIDRTSRSEGSEQNKGASMSTLLNLLDGAITPDGSVIILTTNHIEKIDPALLRPGRVDVRLEFGPPTPEVVSEMLFRRYGQRPGIEITAASVGQVSAAMRGGETLAEALQLLGYTEPTTPSQPWSRIPLPGLGALVGSSGLQLMSKLPLLKGTPEESQTPGSAIPTQESNPPV